MAKAVIFGLEGLAISDEERKFFTAQQPYGFILFKRNIDNPEQVRALTADLKSCITSEFVPILIDQEGGRVARLKPPHWPETPPCATFEEQDEPEQAAYDAAATIAEQLTSLGINVDCAPMLDVRDPEAHDIVGDRAFSDNPENVSALGLAFLRGLVDGGILPIIKHIPGHGRAKSDSHLELPVVEADLEDLLEIDFVPFEDLRDAPYAMTAHIIYKALDPVNCATQSKKVIDFIRRDIGFKGLLMTDDLSMKALTGSFAERTKRSLEAGCDIILHCNGKMQEMQEIAAALPVMPKPFPNVSKFLETGM